MSFDQSGDHAETKSLNNFMKGEGKSNYEVPIKNG